MVYPELLVLPLCKMSTLLCRNIKATLYVLFFDACYIIFTCCLAVLYVEKNVMYCHSVTTTASVHVDTYNVHYFTCVCTHRSQ